MTNMNAETVALATLLYPALQKHACPQPVSLSFSRHVALRYNNA